MAQRKEFDAIKQALDLTTPRASTGAVIGEMFRDQCLRKISNALVLG
jgi:hypothetical protein